VSQFTHPQVFSNLYEFHPSAEHKRWHFEEAVDGPHWLP